MGRNSTYPINKYDARHDVLHVYLNPHCNEYHASSEEPVHNIYVIYDDDTDEIVGFKILDYRRNVEKARQMYPQYDFGLPQQ